jgi:hypothetical protein
MPITLGILAQSRQAVSAGAYDLLESTVLGSAAASVTFSSLGTYASTYQHLQLRITGRYNSSSSGVGNSLKINFNGDVAANYNYHQLYGQSGSVTSDGQANASSIIAQRITSADMTANSFGAVVLDILDPFETTKFKTTRSLGGFASSFSLIGLNSGAWRNTNAISSIVISEGSRSFDTGSRFSLYGIKGA